MFDLFDNLILGFTVAGSLSNIGLCLLGVLIGTLIGVLPGLGPVATIAMLLPVTYGLEPTSALIMLAGIFYGAQYGGSTTAILVNLPGESSSVVTTLDGHQMAKQGRGGTALAIAAIGSFLAGCFATVLIAVVGVPLTKVALLFGPAEYFSLMLLGLTCAVVLARGSLIKALIMIAAGLLLASIGTDLETGEQRLTFGMLDLADGLEFTTLAMGMFGFAEILRNLEIKESRSIVDQKVSSLIPTRKDMAEAGPAIARGTLLGSALGILPGGGATLAAFAAYMLEKKIARDPSRFGRGAIQGVAGPESANNAAAQTSFIPMLTLGIPSNAVMAIMAGALTIHGISPGPQIISKQPELFWGLVASMWLGNLMLVVINLPLVGLWIRLLRVPYRMLFPAIILFCCIGVYSINNSTFDLMMVALFSLLGYLCLKFEFEPAPLLIAFVLGPLMEENIRRALLLSRGDAMVFVDRPISLAFLVATGLLLALAILPAIRSKRDDIFVEG